jgi:hypothetical protein
MFDLFHTCAMLLGYVLMGVTVLGLAIVLGLMFLIGAAGALTGLGLYLADTARGRR